jgi:hypothetical protein
MEPLFGPGSDVVQPMVALETVESVESFVLQRQKPRCHSLYNETAVGTVITAQVVAQDLIPCHHTMQGHTELCHPRRFVARHEEHNRYVPSHDTFVLTRPTSVISSHGRRAQLTLLPIAARTGV